MNSIFSAVEKVQSNHADLYQDWEIAQQEEGLSEEDLVSRIVQSLNSRWEKVIVFFFCLFFFVFLFFCFFVFLFFCFFVFLFFCFLFFVFFFFFFFGCCFDFFFFFFFFFESFYFIFFCFFVYLFSFLFFSFSQFTVYEKYLNDCAASLQTIDRLRTQVLFYIILYCIFTL